MCKTCMYVFICTHRYTDVSLHEQASNMIVHSQAYTLMFMYVHTHRVFSGRQTAACIKEVGATTAKTALASRLWPMAKNLRANFRIPYVMVKV